MRTIHDLWCGEQQISISIRVSLLSIDDTKSKAQTDGRSLLTSAECLRWGASCGVQMTLWATTLAFLPPIQASTNNTIVCESVCLCLCDWHAGVMAKGAEPIISEMASWWSTKLSVYGHRISVSLFNEAWRPHFHFLNYTLQTQLIVVSLTLESILSIGKHDIKVTTLNQGVFFKSHFNLLVYQTIVNGGEPP